MPVQKRQLLKISLKVAVGLLVERALTKEVEFKSFTPRLPDTPQRPQRMGVEVSAELLFSKLRGPLTRPRQLVTSYLEAPLHVAAPQLLAAS